MKKKYLSIALVLTLSSSMLFSSCIGSFSLTNKLLSWDQRVGNKFVNELVFFAFWILPVYEVSALADILVINTIEFWSGDNPVAIKKGTKSVKGNDGKEYLVKTDETGYTITDTEDGAEVRFNFDADSRSWSAVVNGETYELMTFVDDNHVSMPAADGSRTVVEISEAGTMAYAAMAQQMQMTAQR